MLVRNTIITSTSGSSALYCEYLLLLLLMMMILTTTTAITITIIFSLQFIIFTNQLAYILPFRSAAYDSKVYFAIDDPRIALQLRGIYDAC